MNPEMIYRTFIQHTQRCRQCRAAGGELAKDDALCPTSRALARQWGNAEIRHATIERDRDVSGSAPR